MTGFLRKSSATTVSSYSRRVIHTIDLRKSASLFESIDPPSVVEKNDEIDLFYNRVDATA